MRSLIVAAGLAALCFAAPVLAQPQSLSSVGSVTTVTGAPGQVLVARKGQTFTLAVDNPLFDDDLVFTNNSAATLRFNGCTKTLQAGQSIKIDAKVCDAVPVTLSKGQVIGGVKIGETAALSFPPAAVAAGVAVLLGAAAAGGGGGGGGGSPTPASP
jgi:sugar (pentulose or hexulose) kinase